MGRLLRIVVVGDALLRLIHRALDVVEVAIEKIDFAVGGVNPRAAVDPCAPFVELSNGRRSLHRNSIGNPPDDGKVKGLRFPVVEANIQIGSCMLGAAGIGATQHNGRHARYSPQVVDQPS